MSHSTLYNNMGTTIHSCTHFLKRDDLYEVEKPYSLRFTPPEGFSRANIKLERHGIDIQDVRKKKDLVFDKDGMTVVEIESNMSYDDYDREEIIKSVYLKDVSNFIKRLLGAQHVQIFEHTVRQSNSAHIRYWSECLHISRSESNMIRFPFLLESLIGTTNRRLLLMLIRQWIGLWQWLSS